MPKLPRTLRVPAIIDPSDLELVEETMTEYRNAAQYVLDHGIANKLVNRIKLHH